MKKNQEYMSFESILDAASILDVACVLTSPIKSSGEYLEARLDK